jgi:hypothetical protein
MIVATDAEGRFGLSERALNSARSSRERSAARICPLAEAGGNESRLARPESGGVTR